MNGVVQERDTSNEAMLRQGTILGPDLITEAVENTTRVLLPNTSSNDDPAYVDFAIKLNDTLYVGAMKPRNDYTHRDWYLLSMSEDGSNSQILAQLPNSVEYNSIQGMAGKGVVRIIAYPYTAVNDVPTTYFAYSLYDGRFAEIGEEEANTYFIPGTFNAADYLYYSYDADSGMLTGRNVYGETAYKKYIKLTLNTSQGTITGPMIDSLDGDIISFKIQLRYGGLNNPPMGQRESTVTLNKRMNQVINIEGTDIIDVTFG